MSNWRRLRRFWRPDVRADVEAPSERMRLRPALVTAPRSQPTEALVSRPRQPAPGNRARNVSSPPVVREVMVPAPLGGTVYELRVKDFVDLEKGR